MGGNRQFQVGDVVALRSERSRVGAVIEVIGGSAEVRYRVLIDGATSTLYGSQVVASDSTELPVEVNAESAKRFSPPSTSGPLQLQP